MIGNLIMRIGIDVRYLSHGLMGGVHTYVRHFVPAIIDLAFSHQLFLYADTKSSFELQNLPHYVTVRYMPWHSPWSSIRNDLLMCHQMKNDQLDLIHFPANYGLGPSGIRTVITLHDAINIMPLWKIYRGHSKRLYTVLMMGYLHYFTKAAVRKADLILTVSSYPRSEIVRYINYDPSRIVPVPHAPTPDLRRIENEDILADVRKRCALGLSFVLADALKNPAVLIKAWRQLPNSLREKRQVVFFAATP